ncbi:MAG: preprotein translocase subunit SecY [Promethearchaeota archaeon]
MAGKFLKFFSPFVRIMPEIKQPDREVSFKEKLLWTAVVLVLYLVMSNIPLYGVDQKTGTDYFYWLRVILASKRGTLTELGIGPIVTAGLIMQLLMGSKLIDVNMSDPYDRAMFTGAQKVLSIFLTIFQTIAYLVGGAFGPRESMSVGQMILIFMQLLFAGILIILLDEMLQKGWGLGSGVSLFIAAGVAGQIFWNAFSYLPMTGTDSDHLPRGAIIAFFTALFDGDPETKVGPTFIRPAGAPGMLGVFTTIFIFMLVAYFESMRVEIPLQYAGYKGFAGKYPMKLLYVSNIPVILTQALYANVLFFGQLIAGPASSLRARGDMDFWLNLIGSFEQQGTGQGSYLKPTGGLVYYLTPPRNLLQTAVFGQVDALQAVIYVIIFMVLCVFFSRIWVEVSGLAPRDIAGQIIDSGMQVPGFRRSDKIIERILKRYIPTLTILCGLIVGALSFGADALGALSSGTGLLLSVGIIHNYAETISQEAAAEQYPALRGFLGLD